MEAKYLDASSSEALGFGSRVESPQLDNNLGDSESVPTELSGGTDLVLGLDWCSALTLPGWLLDSNTTSIK